MSAAEAPASHKARQRLVLQLQELGVREVDKQRHVCAVWTNGRARRRTELTERDAWSLVARLQAMTADELAAVLAMDTPAAEPEPAPPSAIDPAACLASWDDVPGEPELDGALRAELAELPELPAGAILCGGEPTPGDVAAVAAFAAELAERGPAPTPEALAAVPEPDPADPSTWSELDWIADAEGTGPLSDVPHDVEEPQPEPPAPVAVEPPPADVEEATAEAVRRFRERQAAGIAPTPPDLAALPPRAVVPYAAPGRYCLARCYCGGCPPYADQVADAERAHARELRRALLGPDRDTQRRR